MILAPRQMTELCNIRAHDACNILQSTVSNCCDKFRETLGIVPFFFPLQSAKLPSMAQDICNFVNEDIEKDAEAMILIAPPKLDNLAPDGTWLQLYFNIFDIVDVAMRLQRWHPNSHMA